MFGGHFGGVVSSSKGTERVEAPYVGVYSLATSAKSVMSVSNAQIV